MAAGGGQEHVRAHSLSPSPGSRARLWEQAGGREGETHLLEPPLQIASKSVTQK